MTHNVLRATSGFTLIEMMAVVIIIVMLVAVNIPTFVRTHRAEMLRSEARMLHSTVLHARYQAIVHQQPMLLNLDFDNQAYWVEVSQVTQTNLLLQVLNLSTNALAVSYGVNTAPAQENLSTNAVVAAMPQMTRHELLDPVKLAQIQAQDDTVTAAGIASITFYPNGACQGGLIILSGAGDDTVGVEIDPLTSLGKMVADAQPR